MVLDGKRGEHVWTHSLIAGYIVLFYENFNIIYYIYFLQSSAYVLFIFFMCDIFIFTYFIFKASKQKPEGKIPH